MCNVDFPDRSAGKESTCNAGDPSSIPGLGRSPGEGIGCSLPYSWASLVAQLVKNLPAMRETWVQSLGWQCGRPGFDPWVGKIPWREGKGYPLQYNPWVHKESDTTEQLSLSLFMCIPEERSMKNIPNEDN